MWLEDYREAVRWIANEIPDPSKWIDDVRHHADAESIRAMLRW